MEAKGKGHDETPPPDDGGFALAALRVSPGLYEDTDPLRYVRRAGAKSFHSGAVSRTSLRSL
jgi:hypothetical protein